MSSPSPFPITIVNNSGLSDEVYIVVKGIDASNSANTKQQFYNLATSAWQDNAVSAKLSGLRGGIINMPYIDSGIVYLSIGAEIVFTSRISPPDFSNPSNASFGTTFDKFEISFLPKDGYPYVDITNVDFFCIPLKLSETLSSGTNGPRGFDKGQSTVFASFTSGLSANGWSTIIQPVSNTNSKTHRIVAPNKAVVTNTVITNDFDASFFQAYVDAVWTYYKEVTARSGATQKSIKVDMTEISKWNPKYAGVVFEGMVKNGKFVFSGNDATGSPLADISFDKPSGSDQIKNSVFGCQDLFIAPNRTPQSVPAKNLGAAFNVGILADSSLDDTLYLMPSTVPTSISPNGKNWSTYKSSFYTQTMTGSGGGTIKCYNVYSALIHKNAIGGNDYGFAFDDVTQSDSTLSDPNAQGATVTIGDLS